MVKDKKFYKTILVIALPAAFQAFISLAVNLLDNVMIGNIGGTAGELGFAALVPANQITTLLNFLIKGLAGGAAVLISQYWGKGDKERIRTLFSVVIKFSAAVVLVIAAVVFIFPSQVLSIFTDKENLIKLASEYIRLISITYVFAAVTDIIISMFRCVENIKISLAVPISSLVINFIFNNLFIYGSASLNIPAMGIKGAAYATIIARLVEFSIICCYTFKIDKKIKLRLKHIFTWDRLMFKDFIKFGIPITIGDMQWGIIGAIKTSFVGRMPIEMMNANNIADMCVQLVMLFSNGLASGACVVIGKSVGEKNYEQTRKYSNTIQIMFAIMSVIFASSLFAAHDLFPKLYDMSSEIKEMAGDFIAIAALTLFGSLYHVGCFVGINRGAGDGKFVMKVDMICGWLVVLPSVYIAHFVLGLSPAWVFFATRIDQSFKWLIAFIRLRGNRWIRNVTRE
ncbi:MATE family efflux transporter [Eubacteriales bacterium OttesenSCG-928-G02]|nr:MATE family efflux transporter [Eubacteriales bacterium OttesenSCG-928-G02]